MSHEDTKPVGQVPAGEKAEAVLRAQRGALEAALDDAPLETSLGVLEQAAVAQFGEDVRAAFHLADVEGGDLNHVVGVAHDKSAAVDDRLAGADSLACDPATSTSRPVLTTEFVDYHGCWSFPIHSRKGAYVGAFVIYWRQQREATPEDIELAGLLTQSAGIIIARDQEARRREVAEASLRESEARLRRFADASSSVLWVRHAQTLETEFLSAAFEETFGIHAAEAMGDVRRWAGLIVPEEREAALAALEAAKAGEAAVAEFRILRPNDGTFRWIRNTSFPLPDEGGEVRRIGGLFCDVTEARLSAQHQEVLLAELQHRVRNVMAMIRSITARTALTCGSVEDYAAAMAGRLLALTRVQALLTRAANVGIEVGAIVRDELGAQASHERQFEVEGPEVVLSPKAAEVLTLAVHELTTNALKYGTLAAPEGRVKVRWTVSERRGAPWLSFNWVETGAPAHPPQTGPPRHGFGRELIEGRLPYDLGGCGRIVIGRDGAQCQMEFPLQEGASILETDAPQRATVFGGTLDMSGESDLSGSRVLVIEDDYYLATDTARALEGAGAEVIGPCPTEAAARAELAERRPNVAVVDINLGGRASYDLARTLRDQRIPFVFTTGYDQAAIPDEFSGVERLEKPIELQRIVQAVAHALEGAA